MGIEEITALIGSYGFPIVAWVFTFMEYRKSVNARTNDIKEIKDVLGQLNTTISHNTNVTETLLSHLGRGDNHEN